VRGVTTGVDRRAPGECIVVTSRDGSPKRRAIVRFGTVGTVSRAAVHNNDLPNVLRGLRERVFAVERDGTLQQPPRPLDGEFSDGLKQQRLDLLRHLRGCQPITSSKFLEHYKGAKRARYARAVEDNQRSGVPRWTAYTNSFVKAEFLNLDEKPDPAPRLIQPRHPRFNAAIGVYIQPLEGRIYRAIAKLCNGPTVMKGYNADQVGAIAATAWSVFRNPRGVSLDASRFDQHVSKLALEFEHSVYLGAYSHLSQEDIATLRELLSWQVKNRGFVRLPEADLEYKVEGNRMSGDMNTALGNCLLMCLMVRQYCQERQIQFRLLDNGDDATVFMEADDLPKFLADVKPWFLRKGFTMKVEEPVDKLEQVEFCQTHPVCVDGKYRMVRSPFVALSKDTMWKTPAFEANGSICVKAGRTWLLAVGECGLSLCSGVPVMQSFYSSLVRCAPPGRKSRVQGFGDGQSGFERMAYGLCRGPKPVTSSTRHSFWLAFGITPDVQVCLERGYAAAGVPKFGRHRIEVDSLNKLSIPVVPYLSYV
jgi:hypothetical protein